MKEVVGLEEAPSWKSTCFTFWYGQYISILITGTGIFASLLSRYDANYPMFMASFNYLLLGCYFGAKIYFSGASKSLHLKWYWYFLIALLDVEANVLVTTAYNYTSITSVMLIDCFSIPCTMILSYFFLNAQYSRGHLLGVVLCLVGLILTVCSDIIQHNNGSSSSDPLLGDIMCIFGAIMYACSNVFQETMVKNAQRTEYLAMLGCIGVPIALIQSFAVEYPRIHARHAGWSVNTVLCMCGYIISLFLMYCNTSVFLVYGDAPLFNLSLLTSDVYAIIFAYYAYHYHVYWLYYFAFTVTATGLIVYHRANTDVPTSHVRVETSVPNPLLVDDSVKYQAVDNEVTIV